LRATPDKFGGLILMFFVLIDIFLIDLILDDRHNEFNFSDIDDLDELSLDFDADIEEDDDAGTLLVLFFIGGSDIDEPYTDLASILTLLQFIDYFELNFEDGEGEHN